MQNVSFRKINLVWNCVQFEQLQKNLGKKLSKSLYAPLKVGFRQTIVVNLPLLGKDLFFSFSVSIENDILIWKEFRKSWKYFKWSLDLKSIISVKKLTWILTDN